MVVEVPVVIWCPLHCESTLLPDWDGAGSLELEASPTKPLRLLTRRCPTPRQVATWLSVRLRQETRISDHRGKSYRSLTSCQSGKYQYHAQCTAGQVVRLVFMALAHRDSCMNLLCLSLSLPMRNLFYFYFYFILLCRLPHTALLPKARMRLTPPSGIILSLICVKALSLTLLSKPCS